MTDCITCKSEIFRQRCHLRHHSTLWGTHGRGEEKMIDEKKLTKYIQNRINYWEDKAAEYEIVENTEGMDICVEKAMELGAVMRFIKEQSGEEEMKNQFRPKQEITVGGVKFTIIQTGKDWVKVIASECISYGAFAAKNRNNFAESDIREFLNGEFLQKLIEAGAPEAMFEYFNIDLTADDGLKDYGGDRVRVGLITCDEYRLLRGNIPELSDSWRTATPDSSKNNFVRSVYSDGTLNSNNASFGNIGVRPICVLKSEILKSYLDKNTKKRTEAIETMKQMIVKWNIKPEEVFEKW